jgi:hypothetical protein
LPKGCTNTRSFFSAFTSELSRGDQGDFKSQRRRINGNDARVLFVRRFNHSVLELKDFLSKTGLATEQVWH